MPAPTCDKLLSEHRADAVGHELSRAGIEGTHAFIRGLDRDYDLAIQLRDWLRPLPDDEDFRFSVSVDGQAHWILAERLDTLLARPAIGMVSRMVDQKGLDLIASIDATTA